MEMLGRLSRQSSLFYAAFEHEASLIKDDVLDEVDALLDDEELVDVVQRALAKRSPRSRTTGRRGIAADRLLRCAVLRQIKGWSLRELQRELRASLLYRHFTRFDHDHVPDSSTFSRCFAVIGDEGVRAVHARVIEKARHRGVASGRRFRTDSTVTESNIHHPTDSSLLADGIRVLTRTLRRVAKECATGAVKLVDHKRAAKHRVLEIARAAKSFTESSRARLKKGYGRLLGLTRQVTRVAEKTRDKLRRNRLRIIGDAHRIALLGAQLDHFVPLVQRVIAQTKARVFGGNVHVDGKIVSIFEEHSQVICKGKVAKPTEFGRMVRIDEVEGGIVSNYDVKAGHPNDAPDFVPAIEAHKKIFGRAPKMATADRGYFSARNERRAKDLGVAHVVLPARGTPSKARRRLQKQRRFRRALRWRAGIEARIGTLKHRFGMNRARSKGDDGIKRDVGWSIVSNNLVAIARHAAKTRPRMERSTR